MILGMGIPELAIVLVVVLLIFGPKNLPKIGAALGKTAKNFREGMDDASAQIEESDDDAVEVIETSSDKAATKKED